MEKKRKKTLYFHLHTWQDELLYAQIHAKVKALHNLRNSSYKIII